MSFCSGAAEILQTELEGSCLYGGENCAVLFLSGVLRSFENDFGNEILEEYVYILVYYAIDELCLTLDGVRIFIWLCS